MKPMLATAVELDKIQYPVYGSVKLDGIRALVMPDGSLVSRTLKPIRNLSVQLNLKNLVWPGMDGELIVGQINAPDVYTTTSSGIMSTHGTPDFQYYVFDLYDLTDPYEERLRVLQTFDAGFTRVTVLAQTLLENEEQLLNYEALTLSQGFEGIMLRNPKGLYKYGRSTVKEGYLLKRKPLSDAEGEIIGYEFLRHNDNVAMVNELGHTQRSTAQENMVVNENMVGAIEVRVLNGPFEGTTVRIGTGFTQQVRYQLADMGRDLIGKTVTFSYQAEGAKDKPRFPSFKGFRDKEDIS